MSCILRISFVLFACFACVYLRSLGAPFSRLQISKTHKLIIFENTNDILPRVIKIRGEKKSYKLKYANTQWKGVEGTNMDATKTKE